MPSVMQTTKLMPGFLIGKRSADNARRFLMDIAGRLVFPNPHASDSFDYKTGSYKTIVQISTDAFAGGDEQTVAGLPDRRADVEPILRRMRKMRPETGSTRRPPRRLRVAPRHGGSPP